MSKILPERIKLLRTQLGITQEQLAEKCNVTASCISRWETGKWAPNTENLFLLSRALNVSVDSLCGLVERPVEDALVSQISDELASLSVQERLFVLRMVKEIKELRLGSNNTIA